jgi:hypothetical protein
MASSAYTPTYRPWKGSVIPAMELSNRLLTIVVRSYFLSKISLSPMINKTTAKLCQKSLRSSAIISVIINYGYNILFISWRLALKCATYTPWRFLEAPYGTPRWRTGVFFQKVTCSRCYAPQRLFIQSVRWFAPIIVAARSKAWTVFAPSNAKIVGSIPTPGIYVCLRLIRICVVLFVGSGLATGWSPVQGVLPTLYRIMKL